MYNRRRKNNIIIGSLLAVVCIMAVGYAAFASNLNISGSGAISSNWDIEITGIIGANPFGGDAYDISAPTYTPTTATFNTGLKTPGVDERLYEIEVSNLGTLTGLVTVANLSCGNNSAIECLAYETDMKEIDADGQWKDWYDNSFDIYDGTNDYSDINFTIAPGEKHYLYIDVGYSDSVTSQPENLSANISLELTYEQADPNGNGVYIPSSTVYAFNTSKVRIGTSILTDLGTSYATFAEAAASNSNSGGVIALKYTVVNDVLTEGYACFLKDGTEYCLKGKDTSAFANNVAILNTAFPTCGADADAYSESCNDGSVRGYANSNGNVNVNSNSSDLSCYVYSGGNAICEFPGEV